MSPEPVAFIGISEAMQALQEEIALAARSDAKVLVTGESGAGKEVAARLIHHRSARHQAPFVAVNCAGIPESLLESELFGHVRGSFTGAHRDRAGLLEQAHGGIVFLDEIGEMSLRMQALLLRFLETGEIQRVGADRRQPPVDVRVIAATNRDLSERIAAGTFREDLFYRLNVIHLHVPPLRERRADLPALIEFFLARLARQNHVPQPKLDPAALTALCSFDWPGNVRQLKNVIEIIVVRSRNGTIGLADLPAEVRRATAPVPPGPEVAPAEMLADVVARELLAQMTIRHRSFWSVVHDPFMARDISRSTVRRVIELGLAEVGGSYADLLPVFNMDRTDEKRFLAFLRRYGCLVSVRRGDAPDTAHRQAGGPASLVAG
jgi:DNA-binding NtrC family response regulator